MSLSNPDAVLLGKLRGFTAEERDFLAEVWAAHPTTTATKRPVLKYIVKTIYFGWPLLVLAIIAASIKYAWLTPVANTMVVMVWIVFIFGYPLSTIIANIAITRRASDPRPLLRLLQQDFVKIFTLKAKLITTCAFAYLAILTYVLLMAKHSTTAAALVLAFCLLLASFFRTRILVRKNLTYCVRMVRGKPWLKDFFKTFEA